MPDGLPNLPQLTGPSLAALMPPPALLELLKLAPSLVAPQFPAPLSAPQRLPFELNRVREMMGPTPAPAPPPVAAPAQAQPGGFEDWRPAIARVLAVLGSAQPGQTAATFLQEDASRRERERATETGLQEQFRREQREDRTRTEETARADERFIKQTALESAITGEREDRAAAATEERDRRLFDQQMRKTLGDQTFQANQAELDRIFKSRQEEERRKLDEGKLKLQQQQQRNQLSKEYRRLGAGKFTKELVDYDLGVTTTLSPDAQAKADKIGRLQEIAARGAAGGGGGGTGRIVVDLVNEQGAVIGRMPYDKIKFDSDGGVQGFPGAMLRFPPQAQSGAGAAKPLTREDVRAAIKAGRTPAELRASAKTEEERKIIEAELTATQKGGSTPQTTMSQKEAEALQGGPPALGPVTISEPVKAVGRFIKKAAQAIPPGATGGNN